MQVPPLCSGDFLLPPQAFIAVTMQVLLLRSGVNSLPKKGAELELELSLQEEYIPARFLFCPTHKLKNLHVLIWQQN